MSGFKPESSRWCNASKKTQVQVCPSHFKSHFWKVVVAFKPGICFTSPSQDPISVFQGWSHRHLKELFWFTHLPPLAVIFIGSHSLGNLTMICSKFQQTHWIGFVGKIYRKPWFLPLNMGLSCKFSLKPIQWQTGFLVEWFSIGFLPLSGWWLSHHLEKYEFVSWDDEIPYIWKVIKFNGSKPPT